MKNSSRTILTMQHKVPCSYIPEYTTQQFHGLRKYLMQELKELC